MAAIHVDGRLNLSASTVTGNGGTAAVHVRNPASSYNRVSNTTFDSNEARGLQSQDGELRILNSDFVGNQNGGLLAIDTTTTITGSSFTGGSAFNGGAIFTLGGSLTFADGDISGNTAGSGGGVFASGTAVALRNATISQNTADSFHGGAVAIMRGGPSGGRVCVDDRTIIGDRQHGRTGRWCDLL